MTVSQCVFEHIGRICNVCIIYTYIVYCKLITSNKADEFKNYFDKYVIYYV